MIVSWKTKKFYMKSGTTISSASVTMLATNGILRAGFTVSVPEAVMSGAVSCAVLMSNSLYLDAAKQAIGLEDENGDDHRQRDRQLQFFAHAGNVCACQNFQHAAHETAGDGTGWAAQA